MVFIHYDIVGKSGENMLVIDILLIRNITKYYK